MRLQPRSILRMLWISLLIGCDARDHDAAAPDAGAPVARCEPSALPGSLAAARWDPRFTLAGFAGHDGLAPALYDFAIDPEGALIATGRVQYAGAERVAPLLRLGDDGTWRPAREHWELAPPSTGFSAIAIDQRGALALATYDTFRERRVEIWIDEGAGLRAIGHASGLVRSLAWIDGALWVAGPMTLDEGGVANLAVWSGERWSSPPGGAPDGPVFELLVEEGRVLAGGAFAQIGGIAAARVAEWDGSAWRGLDVGEGIVYALARGGDGALYAGGVLFGSEPGAPGGLLRWSGERWEMVGGGLANPRFTGVVTDLARDGGELYVAGCFTHANGRPDAPGAIEASSLARWNGASYEALDDGAAMGSAWFHPTACGDEGPIAIFDALYQRLIVHRGRVYLAGSFPGVAGVASPTIVAFDGDRWVAQGRAGDGVAGSLDRLAIGGPECIVHALGAGVTHASGEPVLGRVLRWRDRWVATGPQLPSDLDCTAMVVRRDGEIVVGCTEREPSEAEPLGRVLRLAGGRWETIDLGGLGPVHDLALDRSDRVWIAGGGASGYLARWSGGAVEDVARDLDGLVFRVALGEDESGRELAVIGGAFQHVAGVEARRIARFDGDAWSGLGEGMPGTPTAIAIDRGAIWASCADEGEGARALARWSGASWVDVATPERGVDPSTFSVQSILVRGDVVIAAGSIVVGAGDRPRSVFAWDGTSLAPLGGGVGAIGVSSMVLARDALWLGGAIATVGDDGEEIPSIGVARRAW